MGKKLTGILYAVLAAMIYGFTPILARIAFDGGANGITVAFLRGSISLPVLFIILRYKKIPLKPGENWKLILLTGVFGTALTTLLLYMSYNYISVGIATILHFVYPLLVSVACAVFFREKMNRWKITALILCSIGIFMFIDSISSFGITGMFLALLSGGTYALYMVCVDKSQLKHMDYFQLTLYLNFLMSVVAGIFGMSTGELHFSLTPKAWILCVLVSLFIALGALPLTQRAIQLTGASTVAILSTLEPITSIVLGTLILKETVSFLKLTGCVFIIISILLIAVNEGRQDLPKLPSKTMEQHIS
ncbi:EamA-like transporter family protein [Clostridium sp. MSTE9]|uniref:DMT family transporter n=1 Tax=Clostridium sp. (strain MSTE9) TaxID=1105031 RepID=UPI00026F4106|nr:DMT family transporter [Clostridium sp. MSTE9]EJF42071.1 EamA-like transporter family protein [Clostridium sp. MSTE9]